MRTRYALGLAEAEAAAKAGCKEAIEQGLAVTIAIVDDAGALIHLSRLDDASPGSVATAIEKARSAAFTGMETKVLEAIISDRPALVTLGRVAVEGGLPILHKGQKLGGIGVSGAQSGQDAHIASIGLQTMLAVIMSQAA